MKNFIRLFLVTTFITPALAADPAPIVEQDKYDLACEVGAVCLEQTVKNAKHSFHVAPGSEVRIEVSAKNGATVNLVTGGTTMSASYMSIGTNSPGKQNVELEAGIDQTGNFTLDVQVAKVTINGKAQNGDGGNYVLKISRIGMNKPENPPESI